MSPGITFFMERRSVEVVGLISVLIGGALFASLSSYNQLDPAVGHALPAAAHNLVGWPGAYVADQIYRKLGVAAWLVGVLFMGWGCRLMVHRGLGRLWRRALMVPFVLLPASVALSALWPNPGMPVAGGLSGGIFGDVLYGAMVPWTSARIGFGPGVVGFLAGLLAAAAVPSALGYKVGLLRAIDHAILWALSFRAGGAGTAEEEAIAHTAEAHPGSAYAAGQVPKGARRRRQREQLADMGPQRSYELPGLKLLNKPPAGTDADGEEVLNERARKLEAAFEEFGVKGSISKVRPGPVVTLYEYQPAPGVKASKVMSYADDIARAMGAVSARIAAVPGATYLGVELPNETRDIVSLAEMLGAEAFTADGGELTLALGKDIGGGAVFADLAAMPHLLIAGTTGSGKSVGINTMILSLLYRLTPDQCRFIMIDPKMLELTGYGGIPHLLAPVVTTSDEAINALQWTVREMELRNKAMSNLGVRNIAGYNAKVARKGGARGKANAEAGETSETSEFLPLPHIVVVVDEIADLMLVAGKEVESAIQRLAQMARAAGIHIVMATQRPSVDVITGTIKANFPTRISFQVTSKIDSRTILGEQGAEYLLGKGDMLYMTGGAKITRVHGPFVGEDEIARVVGFLKKQGEPVYIDAITRGEPKAGDKPGDKDAKAKADLKEAIEAAQHADDELYGRAVSLVCRERKATISFIQKQLKIGHDRAEKVLDRLETEGVVSPANGAGKRKVLLGSKEDAA